MRTQRSKRLSTISNTKFGGPEGIRTPDLLNAMPSVEGPRESSGVVFEFKATRGQCVSPPESTKVQAISCQTADFYRPTAKCEPKTGYVHATQAPRSLVPPAFAAAPRSTHAAHANDQRRIASSLTDNHDPAAGTSQPSSTSSSTICARSSIATVTSR